MDLEQANQIIQASALARFDKIMQEVVRTVIPNASDDQCRNVSHGILTKTLDDDCPVSLYARRPQSC